MDKEELQALRAFRVQQQREKVATANAEAPPGPKSSVTFIPSPVSDPSTPKRFRSDKPGFDMRFENAARDKPKYIDDDLFSATAERLLRPDSLATRTFRALCATAIGRGAISMQDFIGEFGEVIPRDADTNLDEWPLPAPNVVRDILTLFSSFDSDQFTGSKLPWRHAQSHQSEGAPKPQD